jgi:hypothetical protein
MSWPVQVRCPAWLAAMVAVPVVLLVLGTPWAAAARSGDTAEETLAERFAPVMELVAQTDACGPGEPYQPSEVDPLFDNADVALRGPWGRDDLVAVGPSADRISEGLRDYALDLPGDALEPGCEYETWAQETWGRAAEPTIYARVATEEGRPGRLALQFFFYYPYNDYNNKHESDWERIQLEFSATDAQEALDQVPVRAIYAQHYGSEEATWDADKLELVDESHPKVYVSAGSHASQYSEGLFLGNSSSTGFGCDTTVGPHREVSPVVRLIPSDPNDAAREFPWIDYRGHWGEIGPHDIYTGPTGPNMKLAWEKPFTWSDGARARSYQVPGAEAVGSSATQFFCAAAGRGSDLFRRYASDPGPLLVVLGVTLVGIAVALRRTSWASSALPAARRRSAGEVIAAAMDLIRARRGLFARLTLIPVALLLAAALLQSLDAVLEVPAWLRLLAGVAAALGLVISEGAVVHALASLESGRPVTARSAYAAARPGQPRAFVSVLLVVVVVTALTATVVLVPLALALLVGSSLVVPVVQLENRWGLGALRRSLSLSRRTLSTLVPVFVVCLLVGLFLGLLLSSFVFILLTAPFIVVSAVPPLVTALMWPFVSLLIAYAYYNAAVSEDTPTAPASTAEQMSDEV